MKKLSHYFSIHPITFLYFFIALYAGYFKNYLIIFLIVIAHEMCHLLMAYFFDFKLGKMTLFPFGAFLEIKYFGQYHVVKELLVSIMGPLSHIIIYAFLLWIKPYVSLVSFNYACYFNKLMFLFNILPIYPLDGNKVITILLAYILPYKLTLYLGGIISLFCWVYLVVFYFHIETLLIFCFLFVMQISYFININDIYMRLLYFRDCFCRYSRIKMNPGYSLYRPYFNIYFKQDKN